MATKQIDVSAKPAAAPKNKRAPGVPAKGASTQEAKDLRALINTLSEKNSPESSKDITVFAKQTIKIVGQSQKADSAAFRREATKALVDFRSFIEKTEKVTEARRTKLLSDIDSVALDAKSATLMMLSTAKEQSKTIKMAAHKEALIEKLKAKQNASELLEEAKARAKAIGEETKLKSKAISEEQMAKFKALKEEMVLKQKANAEESKLKIVEQKEKIKSERIELHNKYSEVRQNLADEKAKMKLENDAEKLKIKEARDQAAADIKRVKEESKNRQEAKNQKAKDELKAQKDENKAKTKERIQRIREMTDEHKIKLKRIEEETKSEKLIEKARIKGEIKDINDRHKEKQEKAKKNASELGGIVKDGVMDANPLLHAAIQIGSGIAGFLQKNSGDKKKQKALNRLNHRNTNSPNRTPNPNPAPPSPSPGGNNQNQDSGGGIFGNLLAMIPSVGSVITGIVGFFKTIGSSVGKLGKLLVGTKAIPIIGTAITVVMAIFDFLEGFNNATALFGEKVEDENYVKRIFSGFTNVFASIIGIFDTIAGWMGFDTDLKGMYQKAQVKLYNTMSSVIEAITGAISSIFDSVLSVVRNMAGGIASVLKYVPGGSGAAKALEAFSQAGKMTPASPPSVAAAISSKQNTVDDLKDEIDVKKAKQAPVTVVSDSSTKVNTTNVSTAPLSTRNPDYNAPGYLVTR